MAEPFIGGIIMFGGNFAPRSYAFCSGQLLSIAQNTALFSILGTTYGGNGQTTFALPDLRGRVPIHPGQGPGLSNYSLGQQAGTESNTLTTNNMPAHAHGYTIPANASDGTTTEPGNNTFLGQPTQGNLYTTGGPGVQMPGGNTAIVGGSQPFSILQPYTCVNFIIALEGIFPSRN